MQSVSKTNRRSDQNVRVARLYLLDCTNVQINQLGQLLLG